MIGKCTHVYAGLTACNILISSPPPSLCIVCVQLPVSERQGVPHHLIDVRDVAEDFSAGDFHDLARQAAREIIAVREGGRGGSGRLVEAGGRGEGAEWAAPFGQTRWPRLAKPVLRGCWGA